MHSVLNSKYEHEQKFRPSTWQHEKTGLPFHGISIGSRACMTASTYPICPGRHLSPFVRPSSLPPHKEVGLKAKCRPSHPASDAGNRLHAWHARRRRFLGRAEVSNTWKTRKKALPFWIPPGRYGRTGPPFKPAPAGALAHRPAVIPLGL